MSDVSKAVEVLRQWRNSPGFDPPHSGVAKAIDIIERAITAQGEAVAWMVEFKDGAVSFLREETPASMFDAMEAKVTPLYTTPPAKVPEGYYIASFKRKGSEYPGVMWWGPDNRGYSVDLEQAGIYHEITPGYHDNEYTVPVPASVIQGLRVRRIVDPGDSLNGAFHNAKTLRAMLAAAQQPKEGA